MCPKFAEVGYDTITVMQKSKANEKYLRKNYNPKIKDLPNTFTNKGNI